MTASLADADARERAIKERDGNVIVEASAGTGKTTLIVQRLLELVAPRDGRDPISIDRIAAITFTRKAAGELRVRTRQRLLAELAAADLGSKRAALLQRALAGIDTAHIATIHGFADRLLRKWPVHARLDPHYELDDDPDQLVAECYELLVHAAETGTLQERLRGTSAAGLADEATATILDAQRAGISSRSYFAEFASYHGLDGLVASFVTHRDLEIELPEPPTFDRQAFERFVDELARLTEGLSTDSLGGRWLVETAARVRSAALDRDPAIIYRAIVPRLEAGPRGRSSLKPQRGHDFLSDRRAWDAWKAFDGDERKHPVRDRALRDDLLDPLRRWLSIRLVRLRPVVLALYEQIKLRHRAVDHVDLLLRLRDILRDHAHIRLACQGLFDHVFVDEFQDTDPLQAEIVLFLCEQGADATRWQDVRLGAGRLTVVGDAKQSIYRFRRADIDTYERVLAIVRAAPHVEVALTSSFRSTPALVEWLNRRLGQLMGPAGDGPHYDPRTGEVRYQRLSIGRRDESGPPVHVVPISTPAGATAEVARSLEASAMSRYLRWLVHESGVHVIDPASRRPRSLQYGDIGVLAITTTHLRLLFDAFDHDGIPYSARGGALFLEDPVHRRFLLGLCALSDPDDGVAHAALMRPPFFAIGLDDLARTHTEDEHGRIESARAVIRELRRRRFERSPGATARALLECTGLGRSLAVGPNGGQRLRYVRELCFELDLLAAAQQLDFDAAVARARTWIESPPKLDPPQPVGTGAVRVMTVHQAKGLEFPVVMLWDGRMTWKEHIQHEALSIDRDGRGWAMRLEHVRWEEPAGLDAATRERRLREAERKRLVYVAATRARELLVIPEVGGEDDNRIYGALLGARPRVGVVEAPPHGVDAAAPWFLAAAPPTIAPPSEVTRHDAELRAQWRARASGATRPRMRPRPFCEASSPRQLWGKQGRFGTRFGDTVHIAIGLALLHGPPIEECVRRAAVRTGLTTHRSEAIADVKRALATIDELGIVAPQLEYPIAGITRDDEVAAGYVDLLAETGEGIVILDFKTDSPPSSACPVRPGYISQVRGYAEMVARALEAANVRAGLLYTADGSIHWVRVGDDSQA